MAPLPIPVRFLPGIARYDRIPDSAWSITGPVSHRGEVVGSLLVMNRWDAKVDAHVETFLDTNDLDENQLAVRLDRPEHEIWERDHPDLGLVVDLEAAINLTMRQLGLPIELTVPLDPEERELVAARSPSARMAPSIARLIEQDGGALLPAAGNDSSIPPPHEWLAETLDLALYFDNSDDLAPFGSDEGADLLADWTQRRRELEDSPTLQNVLEMDAADIEQILNEPNSVDGPNLVVSGAFVLLWLTGTIDERGLAWARNAAKRRIDMFGEHPILRRQFDDLRAVSPR